MRFSLMLVLTVIVCIGYMYFITEMKFLVVFGYIPYLSEMPCTLSLDFNIPISVNSCLTIELIIVFEDVISECCT